MPTYRVTLEYDGTRYHGWQEQQNARSIAGELRRALVAVMGEGAVGEIGGSGRTDAGVHALAQTAHLRLKRAVEPGALRRDVNDVLPADIHVLGIAAAPAGFHARHSASSRSYLYQISRRRTAFAKRYVWWVKRPLAEEKIASAAALIAGRHDFRLFCERPAEQPSTLVEVEGVDCVADGALLVLRFRASHFLWKMVRRLTGALVRIGAGELDLERFGSLLEARPPVRGQEQPAEWTAPPSGLFLERVLYPGDPPLAPPAPAVPVGAER